MTNAAILFVFLWCGPLSTWALLTPVRPISSSVQYSPIITQLSATKSENNNDEPVDVEWLKTELTAYLQLRKDANADEAAKQYVEYE